MNIKETIHKLLPEKCNEAEIISISNLQYFEKYVNSYIKFKTSPIFFDDKRQKAFFNDLQEEESFNLYFNESSKLISLLQSDKLYLKEKTLNKRVLDFINDDNGFSIYSDLNRFLDGLRAHLTSDIYVIYNNIERIIDMYLGEHHEA